MATEKQLFRLLLWGILFGYMEAAVVVYLQEIYYPDGFTFPLKNILGSVLWTEVGREAATLLIMAATAALAFERLQSRVAAFAVLFGVWDLCYYLFLKLVLDWPEEPGTWDLLFLIPLPWVGPVWAPMLVSVMLVIAGSALLLRNAQEHYPAFDRAFLLGEVAAGTLIVASFLLAGSCVLQGRAPEGFAWPLFLAGLLLGTAAFLRSLYGGGGSLDR